MEARRGTKFGEEILDGDTALEEKGGIEGNPRGGWRRRRGGERRGWRGSAGCGHDGGMLLEDGIVVGEDRE